jgi:hypothetical protein
MQGPSISREEQARAAPRITLEDAIMAYREFLGADGRRWIAWLADPSRQAAEWAAIHGGDVPEPWLCFSGGRGVHRLRPVPPNWAEVDNQALVELWRRAMEAHGRVGAPLDPLCRHDRTAEA